MSTATPTPPAGRPEAPGHLAGALARARLAAPQVVVPLVAVLVAALVGAAVMAAAGVDPVRGYDAMVRGALGVSSIDFSAAAFTAILAMSLAFAVPARMGEYNLGGDGQLCVGGVAAAVVALRAPLPGPLLLPAALLAAVVAGGALAALSAPLATRARVPVIISTLLVSAPAVALTSYLVRFPLADAGSGVPQSPRLPDAAHLPSLPGTQYTNLGLLLVLLGARRRRGGRRAHVGGLRAAGRRGQPQLRALRRGWRCPA